MNDARRWDIFCKVVDNWGDAGVCWRLSTGLADAGQHVRLWMDDPSALTWMAPHGHPQVQVLPWALAQASDVEPGNVLVEAFGCQPATEFVAAYARRICVSGQKCLWINLEYLSAESYVLRCHGLPSPVLHGPGQGLTKHFYYPGFEAGSGGLLRESDLLQRQRVFDPHAWLRHMDLPDDDAMRVALFCYEPPALAELMAALATFPRPVRLLVTPGRSALAVRAVLQRLTAAHPDWNTAANLAIHELPWLSQIDFDHLLWSCDLNCVRGEDSLVRALWAGKPLLWQIYPQDDAAHHAKLHAFLDWLHPPGPMRRAHLRWNALPGAHPPIQPHDLTGWGAAVLRARARLLEQPDLVSQLLAQVKVWAQAEPVGPATMRG